jgi:HSP20 family protein
MALIRWEPFREIDTLQRQMNRLFDSLTPATQDGESLGIAYIPPAELHESSEAIYLKLEIPGMNPSDLDIQVTAESVAISGERQAETKTEVQGVTRTEFRYGQFRRVIPLTTRIQNDKVHAEYKNGILSLTLPKAEEEKTKVVKVNIA